MSLYLENEDLFNFNQANDISWHHEEYQVTFTFCFLNNYLIIFDIILIHFVYKVGLYTIVQEKYKNIFAEIFIFYSKKKIRKNEL